jgi:protein-L-isoaspartate(D-aspartate) O-methyltransferase
MINDTYKHKGLRRRLVEELRTKGIKDEKVLEAINKVPRHLFLDSSFLEFAYQDKAFPIGSGQTISQPLTVAYQSELLQVAAEQKILEIGTGSGYQACVLMELRAKVFSIERQKSLFNRVKAFLPSIGYNPKLFYGDGYLGLPAFAPFDRILITAAAPEIPKTLLDQLNTGGCLVAPVGSNDSQIMTRITKKGPEVYIKEEFGTFRFVPMLENRAKTED